MNHSVSLAGVLEGGKEDSRVTTDLDFRQFKHHRERLLGDAAASILRLNRNVIQVKQRVVVHLWAPRSYAFTLVFVPYCSISVE